LNQSDTLDFYRPDDANEIVYGMSIILKAISDNHIETKRAEKKPPTDDDLPF
jgi:hypothetical protein